MFRKEDAERLAPYVHGFSLMTYDYSNPQRQESFSINDMFNLHSFLCNADQVLIVR